MRTPRDHVGDIGWAELRGVSRDVNDALSGNGTATLAVALVTAPMVCTSVSEDFAGVVQLGFPSLPGGLDVVFGDDLTNAPGGDAEVGRDVDHCCGTGSHGCVDSGGMT